MAELTQSPHYDYVPIIDREPLKLPNGGRVAVTPYINIEHFPHDIPGTAIIPGTAQFNPDPLNYEIKILFETPSTDADNCLVGSYNLGRC